MVKILTLGNEFIKDDSLAKTIGKSLSKNFNIINIMDSFQLMSILNEENKEVIILDVVKDLQEPQIIKIEDLKNDSILSAHDFDAGYVLKLINKPVRIVGIPMKGNIKDILSKVKVLLQPINF